MAITIDWGTKIISIPKADTQLVQSVPTEIRQLDLDAFRLELKALEDDAAGMPFLDTHNHVGPITVGGVTLARVIEIINGYTVTFEDGQYAVNLVGANSNVGDVTNVNQVSIRSANSAGLTFSDQINFQSYTLSGGVTLNSADGNPGTSFPRGTPTDPVDNLPDALTILSNIGLHQINMTGFFTATGTEPLDGVKIIGGSGASNVLLLSGTTTVSADFERIVVAGAINGLPRIRSCILGANGLGGITGAEGRYVDCIINTTAGIIQDATGVGTLLENCSFTTVNNAQITFNANGKAFGMRKCTGNILITNYTDTEELDLHFDGARVTIDSTCTGGVMNITGMARVIDNSVGTTVNDYTMNANHGVLNQGVKNASLLIPHTTNLP